MIREGLPTNQTTTIWTSDARRMTTTPVIQGLLKMNMLKSQLKLNSVGQRGGSIKITRRTRPYKIRKKRR